MKKKVTVRVLHKLNEGISPSTGRPWKSRTAVLGWQETKDDGFIQDQFVSAMFRGRHAEELDLQKVQVGQELELDFDFSTKVYQSGNVGTEVKAYFPNLFNISKVV